MEIEEQPGADINADAAGRDLTDVFGEDEAQPGEEALNQEQVENGEGDEQTQAGLDPDVIADKIAERWAKAQPQPERRAEPEKTYTPEELDQMFNVWKPTPALVTALREGDVEAAITEIIGMREGLQKQFATVMNMTLDARFKQMEAKYDGFAKETEAIQSQRAEREFYTEHKDLTKYAKSVKLVFGQMVASGRRFADAKAASKAVADETRAYLKELGVSTPVQNNGGTVNKTRMQPLARGGTGGGGSRQSAPTGVSAALRELA